MDTNGKTIESGEKSMTENNSSSEVVGVIPRYEKVSYSDATKDAKSKESVDSRQQSVVISSGYLKPKSRFSMDTDGKTIESGEKSTTENNSSSEVVVVISDEERDEKVSYSDATKDAKSKESVDSPQIATITNLKNGPTKTLSRPKSVVINSVYSKPKSRFGEQSMFNKANSLEEIRSNSRRFRQVDQSSDSPLTNISNNWVKNMDLVESVAFVSLIGCLVATLTVKKLEHSVLWGFDMWKWCVLVMVTISGHLVTKMCIYLVAFLMERNSLLKKVLYVVHGLMNSIQVFMWFSLVLVTWVSLFRNHKIKRPHNAIRILNDITRTIVSLLISSSLWFLKNLMLKLLASCFHVNTFYDRIQKSITNQCILQILLQRPPMAPTEMVRRPNGTIRLSYWRTRKGKDGKKKEMIDINEIDLYNGVEKVSAWTKLMWVDFISNSRLPSTSSAPDDSCYDGGEQKGKEIISEDEASGVAVRIFDTIVQDGRNCIQEMDLNKLMSEKDVEFVLQNIGIAKTRQIEGKALVDWTVKIFKDRKALALALNDTKTAVKELNILVTGILIFSVFIMWLLLVEIATIKVLFFFLSQLLVAAFMFGHTCKNIFEAIIFVFVMHPFDVGDRCVIDGVQMMVEEIKIFTTVFLRFDKEMIYYPNSVLTSKPISNFNRSPNMCDSLEFSIDFMTSAEVIDSLRDRVKRYLEANSLYWHPKHDVVVKEIENMNKVNMVLCFSHMMNFQEFREKERRKSELVIEMKKIFEELKIKYKLLPQEVHIVTTTETTN